MCNGFQAGNGRTSFEGAFDRAMLVRIVSSLNTDRLPDDQRVFLNLWLFGQRMAVQADFAEALLDDRARAEYQENIQVYLNGQH